MKPHIDSFTDCPLRRNGRLQIQALRVKFVQGLDVTFIYCRSTPTEEELVNDEDKSGSLKEDVDPVILFFWLWLLLMLYF